MNRWTVFVLAPALLVPAGGQDTSLVRQCAYGARPDTTWALPKELREISGLALWRATLLAHNDELGRVYAIDPKSGQVRPWLTLQGAPRDDFEGIAVIGDNGWLMTSTGRLYQFPVASSQIPVAFRKVDTGLGKQCEFEGLAADSGNVLLLPCKVPARGKDVVIHRWDVTRGAPAAPATITVPASALAAAGLKSFRPSAIERDPATGHLLMLSANPAALLELDRAGRIVAAISLKGHPQAEGIALPAGHELLIADEGVKSLGSLSRHACTRKA